MRLLRQIIELLAPTECVSCRRDGSLLCVECRLSRVVVKSGACYRCNKVSPKGRTCEACCRSSALAGVVVGSYYEGPVKELILRLKFHRSQAAADALAEILIIQILISPTDFSCITAVPISPSRYRERGYNQAELIAKTVSRRLKIPYRRLLERTTATHQMGNSRAARLAQVQGAFYAPNAVAGKLLIVDDVITTGATLAECAQVLKAAGAKSVWAASVAKH